MFGSKQENKGVIEMYKGKSYIQTIITINTPLDKDSELYKILNTFMGNIEPTMAGLNKDIENVIMDTFEADIVSIYSGVKNL
jgi:hypothetical protein